jgi:hypothetical protein
MMDDILESERDEEEDFSNDSNMHILETERGLMSSTDLDKIMEYKESLAKQKGILKPKREEDSSSFSTQDSSIEDMMAAIAFHTKNLTLCQKVFPSALKPTQLN